MAAATILLFALLIFSPMQNVESTWQVTGCGGEFKQIAIHGNSIMALTKKGKLYECVSRKPPRNYTPLVGETTWFVLGKSELFFGVIVAWKSHKVYSIKYTDLLTETTNAVELDLFTTEWNNNERVEQMVYTQDCYLILKQSGSVFKWKEGEAKLTPISGMHNVKSIRTGHDGAVIAVTTEHEILFLSSVKKEGKREEWEKLLVVSIIGIGDGMILARDKNDLIIYRKYTAAEWAYMSPLVHGITDIKIGNDMILALDGEGKILYRTGIASDNVIGIGWKVLPLWDAWNEIHIGIGVKVVCIYGGRYKNVYCNVAYNLLPATPTSSSQATSSASAPIAGACPTGTEIKTQKHCQNRCGKKFVTRTNSEDSSFCMVEWKDGKFTCYWYPIIAGAKLANNMIVVCKDTSKLFYKGLVESAPFTAKEIYEILNKKSRDCCTTANTKITETIKKIDCINAQRAVAVAVPYDLIATKIEEYIKKKKDEGDFCEKYVSFSKIIPRHAEPDVLDKVRLNVAEGNWNIFLYTFNSPHTDGSATYLGTMPGRDTSLRRGNVEDGKCTKYIYDWFNRYKEKGEGARGGVAIQNLVVGFNYWWTWKDRSNANDEDCDDSRMNFCKDMTKYQRNPKLKYYKLTTEDSNHGPYKHFIDSKNKRILFCRESDAVYEIPSLC